MASPCIITFNGKDYSYEDFASLMHDGGLEKLVSSQIVKLGENLGGDGVKKTLVTKRAYEGEFREDVKKELEKIGLTREIANQDEAVEKAKSFVDEVGIETALDAVRNGDIKDGDVEGAIYFSAVEDLGRKINESNDEAEISSLVKQQAELLNEIGTQQLRTGRFNAIANKFYQDSDLGYNSSSKTNEWKEKFGAEPTEELKKAWAQRDLEFAELNKKLAEAEKRAKEAEEKASFANIKESVERGKKRTYSQRAKVVADKIRSLKNEPIEFRDENGNVIELTKLGVDWNDIVESVAKAVELGGKVADAVSEALSKYDWYNKLSANDQQRLIKQLEAKFNADEKTSGKIKIPHSLIRDLVEGGIDNIDDLTKAVKEAIKEDYPDATEREVRDAITGYGKTINPSKGDVEASIRRMKRIGRVVSALEDVANKKRPLRSGKQRDKLDAEERALQTELREAMKDLPETDADIEKQLKTQLDAAKTRLQNQIEDLQREIDNKELTPRNSRTVKEDAELKALQEQRDKLREEHDAIFKDDEYKNAKRLELAKKATKRRIEDLQRRLDEKDFSKKEVKPLIADDEITKLRAEKVRLKDEYDREFYKEKLRNRTDFEKAKDLLWDAWGLTRLLRATGEASFVLIQGGIPTISQGLSKPKVVADAFKTALRSFASPEKTEQWLHEIKSQEWYPIAKESKLALTEPHAELTAREELFYSDWTDALWNTIGSPLKLKSEGAYENWKKLNPAKAFERAAVGYLDTLRVARFLDGVEILKEQGKTFQNSPQDYKDVADMVNTFTGRGSIGKNPPQWLTKVFFSPRNWASAVKTATPYGIYHFGKMTPTARKMAISDYSKFIGLTTGLVGLAAVGLNNDKDEETKVELDPRSSDFGKIKIGNTRVDPWGGRIQQIVLQARIFADFIHDINPNWSEGGMKTNKGEILPLGIPHKTKTKAETAMQMAVNKLAPSAALFERWANTEYKKVGGKLEKVDEHGKPYSVSQEIKSNLYPIIWDTWSELLADDPTSLDGLLSFYAFFGGGVNTYETTKPKVSQPLNATNPNPNKIPLNQNIVLPRK